MKHILLLGSAGYMPAWIEKNMGLFVDDIFVCAMNNAWALCPKKIDTWFRSTDFYLFDETLKPSADFVRSVREVTHYLETPYWYDKKSNGTMGLNVLCHIINELHQEGCKGVVYLAGCDMDYSANAHFYDGGQPDPLRFGESYLKDELSKIKDIYDKERIGIFNVGGNINTLLPFDRIEL